MPQATIDKLKKSDSDWKKVVFILIFLGLAGYISMKQLDTPSVIPASAEETMFSSERAFRHYQVIGKKPRPVGSEEIKNIRDYIIGEVKKIGYHPEVQDTVFQGTYAWSRSRIAKLENIIVKVPGSQSSKAILVVGHYDSVFAGPGAGDNGISIVSMLEILRALKSQPPLKNDIIFLFSDAEEIGLMGAQAFLYKHPYAQDVGFVINSDAGGGKPAGPSLLIETGNFNPLVMAEFSRTGSGIFSSSLTSYVWQKMPNSSDFSIFQKAGIPGFNLMYIGDWVYYHLPSDNIGRVDPESIQHHGSGILALINHFGAKNLNDYQKNPDQEASVYFSVFGHTIHYSNAFALPITIFITLAIIILLAVAKRKKEIQFKNIIYGFIYSILTLVISSGLAYLAWEFIKKILHPLYRAFPINPYNRDLYICGFLFFSLFIFILMSSWIIKKISIKNLYFGSIILLLALLAGFTLYMLPGTYFLAIPLLFAIIQGTLYFIPWGKRGSWLHTIITAILSLPAFIIILPMAYMIIKYTRFSMMFVFPVILFLLFIFLLPFIEVLLYNRKKLLLIFCGLMCLLLFTTASLKSGFSKDKLLVNGIWHIQDCAEKESFWAGRKKPYDNWTRQFLKPPFQLTQAGEIFFYRVFKSPAPYLSLPGPEVQAIDNLEQKEQSNGKPIGLEFQIFANSPSSEMIIMKLLKDECQELFVNDTKVDTNRLGNNNLFLFIYGFGTKPVELKIIPRDKNIIRLVLIVKSHFLPEVPGIKKRENFMISRGDAAFIIKTFSLPIK